MSQADFEAGSITNTATVTGAPTGGSLTPATSQLTVTITGQAPALTVVKSSDHPSYTLGDTITYSYKVTNTGNVTINAVSVSDDKLGAITACTATSLAPGGSMTCTATHVVSQAEFEAIAQRLTRSARHFSFGAGSTNYFDNVGAAFR